MEIPPLPTDDLGLLQGQQGVLEMVAAGAGLADVLLRIAAFVEAQEPGARCAIVLVSEDGTRFGRSFGASLPPAFHDGVAGLALLPEGGPCARAVLCGQTVAIADIAAAGSAADPWRALALSCGLCSVCATPVRGAAGQTLATLGLYHGVARDPRPANPRLIGSAAHLAAIAIQRARDADAASAQASRFKTVFEQAPTFMAVLSGPDHVLEMANPGYLKLTGLREVTGRSLADALPGTAQDDLAMLDSIYQTGQPHSARGTRYAMQAVAGPADIRFVDFVYQPITDAAGRTTGIFIQGVDVTDRVEAEQRLRESDERLRLAQRAAGIGTFEWFPQENRIEGSEEYRRLWGFGPDGEMSVDAMIAMIDPADLDRIGRVQMAGGQDAMGYAEFRITLPATGEERWLARNGRAMPDPRDQDCLRFIGVAFDVTERKRGELAVRRSEEEFRTLAENLPALCWMAWPDGHIYWFNQRWYDYTGKTAADMAGWGWQSVHDPARLPAVLDRWRDSIAEAVPFEMTFPLRGRDGVYRSFLTRVAPVQAADGSVLRWLGTNTDVTELGNTQAALADSQARLQAIFDTVPVSIVFAEAPSGRLVFGNAGVERVFRYSMRYSDGVGAYQEWEAYHADGTRVAGAEFPLAVALTTGEPSSGEYQFVCGDGARRWIGVSSAPIRDAAGRLTGAVVVCSDIDDLRRAQIILSQNKTELERLVAERTRELETTQTRLAHAQRMEALGQLAGGIAHDFNNVVQAVQGGARLIERRPGDVERVRTLAGMIAESAGRGAAITRRLLAFSRRGDLRAEPVDAAALLASMQEILVHTLGGGITVRVDVEGSLPPLLADKGQLETVLVNLATNARDAMQDYGTLGFSAVLEVLGAADAPDHPATLPPGAYIRLAVSDTGSGMSPAVLERAAEPFFTTKPVGQGTGLGLAMSRGFAEQSGGWLHIESEVGRGTVVKLWFPVAQEAARPASRPPQVMADPARSIRARLLLVDDEKLVRETLSQQLEDEGFSVTLADGGETALALLDAGAAVDLMIADLSMPGMDGLTLARGLQARRPGLPVILLTGFATNAAELAVSGAVSGAFTLLRKPVEAALLAERVALMLEVTVG